MSIQPARRRRSRSIYQTKSQKMREEWDWAARSGQVISNTSGDSASVHTTSRPFVARYNAGRCRGCLKPVNRGQGVRYVDGALMHGVCS